MLSTHRTIKALGTAKCSPAIRSQIYAEITRENRSVRQEYVQAFGVEAKEFSDVMGDTLSAWLKLYESVQGDERRMKVLAIAYAAISLQIGSMKLFLSGHQIAAGNLMRQVLEAIALAFLCSGKDLGILDLFEQDKYSTSNAITDARRNAVKLNLKKTALEVLKRSQAFYSNFSHPSKMTLGTLESFTGEGIYLGATYDQGKYKHYRTEALNRLKLAKQFPGFLQAVQRNLAAW